MNIKEKYTTKQIKELENLLSIYDANTIIEQLKGFHPIDFPVKKQEEFIINGLLVENLLRICDGLCPSDKGFEECKQSVSEYEIDLPESLKGFSLEIETDDHSGNDFHEVDWCITLIDTKGKKYFYETSHSPARGLDLPDSDIVFYTSIY